MLILVLLGARPRAEEPEHGEVASLPVARLGKRDWLLWAVVAAVPAADVLPIRWWPGEFFRVRVQRVPKDAHIPPGLVQKDIEAQDAFRLRLHGAEGAQVKTDNDKGTAPLLLFPLESSPADSSRAPQ